jgi:hypothetical protein
MNAPDQAVPPPPSRQFPYWLRVLLGAPLVLLGGVVTLCLGFFLCIYVLNRISGGRPWEPTLIPFFLVWLIFGAGPLSAGILVLQISRTNKRLCRRVLLGVLLLFLAVGADGNFGPTNWHRLFRDEKLPGTYAASLKHTIVSSDLDATIRKGTNVLWCGTFQLAWNEACQLVGGDLRFKSEHPMVSTLNKHGFTKESLDESSYVAMAGFVGDSIHNGIRKAVEERFHGAFQPRFIPDKRLTDRPQDFVVYACLFKSLHFPTPFERLDETLIFNGVQVSAFGAGRYKPSLEKVYPRILILDYRSEDDFVIELKTKSEGDRLIVAKLEPKANLSETITSIGHRIKQGQAATASTNDLLLVPRVKLDITREYSEIQGVPLLPQGANVAKDLRLLRAVQNTLFEMNEKGVELKSEAHMRFACKQEGAAPRHKMIFDKPFLIFMQRRDAQTPYFALWVDNPEVLISWK